MRHQPSDAAPDFNNSGVMLSRSSAEIRGLDGSNRQLDESRFARRGASFFTPLSARLIAS